MSNPKIKSENYTQFAGINSKSSPYLTSPMEFLDLKNLDFQLAGSLSHRWGSTQYVGQTFVGPIKSLFEFQRLDGSSYVIIGNTGGLWSGATTGNSQGLSLTNINATLITYANIPIAAAVFGGGQFNLRVVTFGAPYQSPESTVGYGFGETFVLNPYAAPSGNKQSYSILDNFLFIADGSKFIKYDGITLTPVGLPPPLWTTTTGQMGLSLSTRDGATLGFPVGESYGVYYFWASYVNNRGFEGPIYPVLALDAQLKGAQIGATAGSAAVDVGSTLCQINIEFATPIGFGISSIKLYSYYNASYGATIRNAHDNIGILANSWVNEPIFVSSHPASGSTSTYISAGINSAGFSAILFNFGEFPDAATQSYSPIGLTIGSYLAQGVGTSLRIDALVPTFPQIVETYQNRLFLGGFSVTPSTVWFSDLAEPEGYAPDFNFEVRTNDGDYLTCLRAYSTQLYMFKQKSFHILTGDNPLNFFLKEISDQYGCVNNRCAVIYDDILVFLDRKGVIMWNGAALTVLSNKVQPTFDTMNYSAALTEACMEHDKIRNQIVVGIPINGSSTNNITMVYDYLVGAWTKYEGFSPSAFKTIQGRNNTKNLFYGDYSGRVNWFGSSFLADNGAGFTTYLKSRFLHDLGESTEKMFRRLFLNTDSPASSTFVFGVNFYKDYGNSIVLGTTIVLSQFQNRIDYGVSGKSLAFELATIQSSLPLRIHGFTIESRYLRSV